MSKAPAIFISYNPKAPEEETLAVRLQTIGAINGFTTYLPDRYNVNYLNEETIRRIEAADYYVIFVFKRVGKRVLDEMNVAYQKHHDKSKIILIYDEQIGHPLNTTSAQSVTSIPFNPRHESVGTVINRVVAAISRKEQQKEKKNFNNGLLAFLGVGLGILALGAIAGSPGSNHDNDE